MSLEVRVADELAHLGVAASDRLGLAVSGGADSVALLRILRATMSVHIVHVDHALRDGSRDDARFVAQLADELGLPSTVLRVDVDAQHPKGPEAAAREVRYAALEAAARDHDLDWIATAHTLDDQAETVLMRTLRGGVTAGIRPVRGIFVRPLLGVRRAELRAWLSEHGHQWREDPTNLETRYERNWIRREVMPLVELRRPGAAVAIARTAALARDDEDALESLAAAYLERASFDDAGALLEGIDALPRAVALRAVRRACRRLGCDPTADQLRRLVRGAADGCGGIVARRVDSGLALMRHPVPVPETVAIGRSVEVGAWGVRARVADAAADRWTWSSPVPTGDGLVLRARRTGDRVRTRGGTRKVSDVLVDAKIPHALRDFVPVLATPDAAVAVVGLTAHPDTCPTIVDVAPSDPTWSRAVLWK